ncbi:hypothetical protein ACEQ6A_25605 [Rhizobium brockwellii]|uniref:hypothetical protein n=1 Tax=Rhizobium brockwellii TaxID=3019932 RepID=UPI003F976896
MGRQPGDILRPANTDYDGPIGYCIYCGGKDDLGKEHIVPYFLLGQWVLRDASCKKCAKVTRGFEDNLSYTVFNGLRRRFRFQSRSKGPPPKFPLTIIENGVETHQTVSADELPPLFVSWEFEPPGLLEGRETTDGINNFRFRIENLAHLLPYPAGVHGKVDFLSDPYNLMRLAAKIAHGLMYFGEATRGKYEPLLNDVILTGNFAPYFVGGFAQNDKVEIATRNGLTDLHKIDLYETMIAPDTGYMYLIALMHLLPELGGPKFQVIVGRRRLPMNVLPIYPVTLKMPISNGKEIGRYQGVVSLTFST